jgi:hypothetical protein
MFSSTRRRASLMIVEEMEGEALDRWDQEGGAPASAWALKYRRSNLADHERDILERLGAAVVCEWNALPTDIQRALFRYATSGESFDPAQLKVQLARFLHNRKDGAAFL